MHFQGRLTSKLLYQLFKLKKKKHFRFLNDFCYRLWPHKNVCICSAAIFLNQYRLWTCKIGQLYGRHILENKTNDIIAIRRCSDVILSSHKEKDFRTLVTIERRSLFHKSRALSSRNSDSSTEQYFIFLCKKHTKRYEKLFWTT